MLLRVFGIFFLLFSTSSLAVIYPFEYYPIGRPLGHKAMMATFSSNYFNTTALYDYDGIEHELLGDESFVKYEFESQFRYGLGFHWDVFGGLRYRRNESTDIEPNFGNSRATLSRDDLESIVIGTVYRFLYQPNWTGSFELRFRKSLYDNPIYDSRNPLAFIVLGDDGTEVTVGPHFIYRRSQQFSVSTSFLYSEPNQDLSREILYDVHAAWSVSRFAFIAGIGGIYSLRTDDYSDFPETKPRSTAGATNIFNSINRSYISPYAGLWFFFNRNWRLELSSRYYTEGHSTDEGNEAMIKLVWWKTGYEPKEVIVEKFKDYSVDASVIKVSPRSRFVVIDRGLTGDLEKGMRVDFYRTDYFGGNILVSSGIIFEIKADTSVVKIDQVYRDDIKIEVGFTARSSYAKGRF